MLRAILGVIVGYVVMAIVVMVGLGVLYTVMGPERAYKPGVWDITTGWAVGMVAVGVVAALLAGVVCGLISRSRKALVALVVVVALLGGLSAIMQLAKERSDEPRPAEFSMQQAADNAKQPVWTLIANPVIGMVGTFAGGTLVLRKNASAAKAEA